MKNLFPISFLILIATLTGCSSSTSETRKPLKTYYRDCTVLEYNAWEYDFYEIVQVWGPPTDTLHFGEKPPKMTRNLGPDDYWNEIAYAWSDTSKVKVEGKLTLKLIFDAEIDSLGNYHAVKGAHTTYVDCFPLQETAY